MADKRNDHFKAMLKIEDLTGEVAELKKELNEQINQEHSSSAVKELVESHAALAEYALRLPGPEMLLRVHDYRLRLGNAHTQTWEPGILALIKYRNVKKWASASNNSAKVKKSVWKYLPKAELKVKETSRATTDSD